MKVILRLSFLLLCFLATGTLYAQWSPIYATYDDADSNGVGTNTPAVGVISENMFIALAGTPSNTCSFLLPYVNATAGTGRLYSYGYDPNTDGSFQVWTDGVFDQAIMSAAFQIRATRDSLIYVANNDTYHNILVFKFEKDTINTVPVNGVYPRQETGTNGIFGIDVDQNGYVYVCNDTTAGKTDDIKVYAPITQWTSAHTDAALKTIDLPDGIYKGLAVSPDGHHIFVSDYTNRKVLKFSGSPAAGYTADPTFHFALGAADTVTGSTILPVPLGMTYMASHNILFVALDSYRSSTYPYGRVYLLNSVTGALVSPDSAISVINVAAWYASLMGGSYTARTSGKVPTNVAGYTTVYDVKLDEKGNMYTVSNNGWSVEKWSFTGSLPVVTSVEEIKHDVPEGFQLFQNYPNPFNPSTRIDFSVAATGFVSLKVFNVLGQEVASLVNESMNAGQYRVVFDARSLPSGTYFASLRAGSASQVRKMMLVK